MYGIFKVDGNRILLSSEGQALIFNKRVDAISYVNNTLVTHWEYDVRKNGLNFIGEDSRELYHKGIRGSIEWSCEDECWHGKILNTVHLITYEGKYYEDFVEAFKLTVDEHVEVGLL